MRLRRSLGLSLAALGAHRLRAALAVAGVAAGVGAVVLTSALGRGVAAEVGRKVEAMGTNLLVVRPAPARKLAARRQVAGFVTTLRPEDAAALGELALVAAAAPSAEAPARVEAGAAAMMTKVVGTTSAFPAVRNFRLRAGRFFDDEDDRAARRVAVLGARVAATLFGDEEPVGRPLRIRGVPFDVVGVLAPKGVLADGDEDDQVLVPLRTVLRRVLNARSLSAVYVSVAETDAMGDGRRDVRALLRERHGTGSPERADDFEVQDAARFYALQQQTAASLELVATGLAGLALVVGGTGILALMLTSVRERRREIGLRMAVGARPRDVLAQFLLESTLLSLAGWVAGLAGAALGALGVVLALRWTLAVPVAALLASLAMALTIGLGFGAVPARRASLLPPVQALGAE
jgi:putative ABC transport system permease protein